MTLNELDYNKRKLYIEKTYEGTKEDYIREVAHSNTVYVGRLPLSLPEERIWALFGFTGEIRRVVYGVNKDTLMPCGFAFVEYYNMEDANSAVDFFDMYKIDNVQISVNKDIGFSEGRQFGRGEYGNTRKGDDSAKRRRDG